MRASVLVLLLGACRHPDGAPGSPDTNSTPPGATWYEDHDGDGLGGDVPHEAVAPKPGWVSSTGDCDDEDPDVLGPSTWYLDGDGDGFAGSDDTVTACDPPTGAQATAEDCDDADRAVYPGAPVICGDGVVNDCDGPADPETGCRFEGQHDVATDRWQWTGEAESALGYALGAADVDGDGEPELLLAAGGEDRDPSNGWEEGVVYVLRSNAAPGPASEAALAEWYGVTGDQQVGRGANGVGDLDGDGRDEVLVAAGSDAFLVSSLDPGSHTVESVAVATFPFSTGYDHFTSLPDPTGSGRLLAIGAWEEDWVGRIRVYRGALAGTLTGPDAWMTIQAQGSDETGTSLATIDADGDGDRGIASVVRERGAPDCGGKRAVFVTEVLASGTYEADEVADAWWHACEAQLDQVDSAGDVNGDGYEDLLVGAQGGSPDLPWYGFLYEGPLAGTGAQIAEETASVAWVASSGTAGGVPVEGGGDLDADGFDDVIVYATNWDGSANHFGDLNVFYGPLEGTLDVQADADASFYDERYTRLGEFEMEFVGDLDHDGRDDLLVGATNWGPYPEYHYGAAYLILGGEVF